MMALKPVAAKGGAMKEYEEYCCVFDEYNTILLATNQISMKRWKGAPRNKHPRQHAASLRVVGVLAKAA